MPFDPNKWKERFSSSSVANFIPCPDCEKFELEAGERGYMWASIQSEEESPLESMSRFVLLLKCKSCDEMVAMAGSMHRGEEVYEDPEEGSYDTVSVETFLPFMIEPPPKLFPIPRGTAPDVKKAIVDAFRLYWCVFQPW